ncbi:MAG: ade7 [Parcubacteria group bacterium]|nr:ade7 [Parcubacteria group bacterium]
MTVDETDFAVQLETALETQNKLVALIGTYLKPIGTGKVRYLFDLPQHPDLMAVFVSDNWSARDFVFGFVIPEKGKYLNIATIAMKRYLRNKEIETDLVAYARYIDEYLPPGLRGNRELWNRMTIVRKCEMIPVEVVLRNNLFGSAWKDYNNPKLGRVVCGQLLSEGLPLFAELSPPFQSPTTKAKTGHDLAMTKQAVDEEYPGLLSEGVYILESLNEILEEDSLGRCIDIKFELGRNPVTGIYVLCDEISPDSSRLCRLSDYLALEKGEVPEFLDKEFGRAWADALGIDKLDPASETDKELVRSWRPDEQFVQEFMRRYAVAFWILSRGHTLNEYRNSMMAMS